MDEVLKKLEQEPVFKYFLEFSKIPRGSYHIDAISDYLADFAKKRNLEYIQDDAKNVIIFKEATPGYEEKEPLILQGHMDMVAVKEPGCEKDMEKDPLELFVEGDFLGARGTSLGGDDGAAMAIGLALLDDDALKHPRLEVIFTTNEETGMEGAKALDLSVCKGNRMINLDSEDEGIFLAGCAGGAKVEGALNVNREKQTGIKAQVRICGLHGGHSGQEIGGGYANALMLAGRFMRHAFKELGIRLIDFTGGEADNVIPKEAELSFLLQDWNGAALKELCERLERDWRNEWGSPEPGLTIELKSEGKHTTHEEVLSAESMETLSAMLCAMPNGVQAMSPETAGLVETSLNLGKVALERDSFRFLSLVRSSKDHARDELLLKLEALVKLAGGSFTIKSPYPGWQYDPDSVLRKELVELYEEVSGKKGKVEAIHAGLECGIFMEKRPELDCISIGPDMKAIHTTGERLSVSSTRRVYELVRAFIEKNPE